MPLTHPVALLLAISLAGGCFAAEPPSSANWATDGELDGIVDLLDIDYLKRPINVARLPLKFAVTTVHGLGERTVYTFEDPNCGFCRQLTQRLEQIGNVTIHTFMLTFLGNDSRAKADAVWCTADRSWAWLQVMNARRPIKSAPQGCRAPNAETMKLAGLLGINLTPTLFFADGSRINGIRPLGEIESRLESASRERKKAAP